MLPTWLREFDSRYPLHNAFSSNYLKIYKCKNYSSDVNNPELDQLAGRFSTKRGRLGLLSCRKIYNESLFIKRCIDTFKDDNGLIIPITNNDIIQCLESQENISKKFEKILFEKSRTIITG